MTLQILLIADSDSQLLACQALARFSNANGATITVNAIPRDGTPEGVLKALELIGTVWTLNAQALLAGQAGPSSLGGLVDVKLEQQVTGRQRHLVDLPDVPCGDDVAA